MKIRVMLFALVASALTSLTLSLTPRMANAEERSFIYAKFHNFDKLCGGHCAVAIYGGQSSGTDTFKVFGLNGLTPVWDWEWDQAYLGAVAVSRRLLTFGMRGLGDTSTIELEAGFGQRFGDVSESEFWIALHFRWINFPWNDFIYTTVAASTGFSYATGAPALERRNSDFKGASRLMHFFSPEITFALPKHKHIEFLIRYHHRSGVFRNPLFGYTTGGLNFLTMGFRLRF